MTKSSTLKNDLFIYFNLNKDSILNLEKINLTDNICSLEWQVEKSYNNYNSWKEEDGDNEACLLISGN